MAAWVVHCWRYLELWLQEGPQSHFCKDVDLDWTSADSITETYSRLLATKSSDTTTVIPAFKGLIRRIFSRALLLHKNQESDRVILDGSAMEHQPNRTTGQDPAKTKGKVISPLDAFKINAKSLATEFVNDLLKLPQRIFGQDQCKSKFLGSINLDLDIPFARFGKSVVSGDFDGDGRKQLGTNIYAFLKLTLNSDFCTISDI